MRKKAALDPKSDEQAQPEGDLQVAPQLIVSAHKKHPLQDLMQGVLTILTAEVGLADLVTAGKLCAGAAEGDAAGL